MSDNKKKYHDKGEKDSSKGKYKPPHGIIDELTTWSNSGMKRINEENEAYNKGYRNNQKQKK